MTQSKSVMKRLLIQTSKGCIGCRHYRCTKDAEHYCILYGDYPTDEDVEVGCKYREEVNAKTYRR